MAKINLLPWREEYRKQQQQDFIIGLAAGALATVLVIAGVYLYFEGLKEYHERRNQMLRDEIAVLDRKIKKIKEIEEKKDKLLTKIDVIQKLQKSRPEIVHLFDELPKVTPDGVYLTNFKQTGPNLSLDGKAESNARVSAFMRSIENSPWLKKPKLDVIKGEGKKNDSLNDFSMTAQQGHDETAEANE